MPSVTPIALPDYVMLGATAGGGGTMHARLLGARIDTRAFRENEPASVLARLAGPTIVFRDGVVVGIGEDRAAMDALDAALAPRVVDPFAEPEREVASLVVLGAGGDSIGPDGSIQLADESAERVLLAGIVLARSVMLSRDEGLVGGAFERISPLVSELSEDGRTRLPIRQAMRLVGTALAARHRIMGTASANDRPDLLWDHPELDRLYARLEDEYELDERAEVLERKFTALGDVTEVLLDIVRDKRAFRLELAIIALIAFEIVLSLVAMALR